MSLIEHKVAESLGRIEGKIDAFDKSHSRLIRMNMMLNICGMTGGTITVGTQLIEGFPVIEKLMTMMGGL